jgi:hypothetical protein
MIHTELFNKIDDHFVSDHSLARVRAFLDAERQVEGWFKGELLWLLKSWKDDRLIDNWKSEYRAFQTNDKRHYRRMDFFIELADGPLYLELKTFYHGTQAGQNVDLGTCFTFLPPDIDKLANLPSGNKFLLVFVTPNPESKNKKWQTTLDGFRKNYPNVSEIPARHKFPEEIYIAKLKVV